MIVHRALVVADVEAAWLTYSRAVLGDDEHRRQCTRLGGSPAHPGVDSSTLRWPGYLGVDARIGECVLVVSNIHRDFASAGVSATLRDRLIEVTDAWSRGLCGDDEYLAAVRAVYETGLARWTVGRHVRHVTTALGHSARQIAFTNAARCQFPEVPPPVPAAGRVKRQLQALCLQRFPVDRLVEILEPLLVLFTSTEAFELHTSSGRTAGRSVPMILMHQLNGRLLREVDLGETRIPAPSPREEWVPQLVDALRTSVDRRSTRATG